jgi:hypothetical protein
MSRPNLVAPVTIAFVVLTALTALPALAEEPAPPLAPSTSESGDASSLGSFVERYHPGFGARVGGYQFRSGQTGLWNDCPMGGVGVFGTLDLNRYVFVEVAADTYDTTPLLSDADGDGMDRVSYLGTAAIGARMFPDSPVVPYVQVGVGAEWTRVTELSQRVEGVYPVGFIGVGGELNVFRHIKAGADLRFLGMAHPYEDDAVQPIPGVATGAVRMELAPAGQALFYARYVL